MLLSNVLPPYSESKSKLNKQATRRVLAGFEVLTVVVLKSSMFWVCVKVWNGNEWYRIRSNNGFL
jgi:hypothetical protein